MVDDLLVHNLPNSESWQRRLSLGDAGLHVHLIGIGGAGLSAIARVLLETGVTVSGSDRRSNRLTASLTAAGARVFIGQRAENLDAVMGVLPDVVLISSAVDDTNEERQTAVAQGIPVVKRNEFLPALLADRITIAVAGTHGKSTTTAMIVTALHQRGIKAGYIIGAEISGLGNASAGDSKFFVIEADEYDHMFLGLQPSAAVITNVEWDHPDCFPSPASFRRAFMRFADNVRRDGLVVYCADDEGARQVHGYRSARGPQWLSYGTSSRSDLRASHIAATKDGGMQAELSWWHTPACRLKLGVPGHHNVLNAMAALIVANWCDIPLQQAADSLTPFAGAARRFEIKGEAAGIVIIDDYAHHPTEIRATLSAARGRFPTRRIRAVFQPHTFSRTRRMLYRMGDSFADADQVIVTDIYAARETSDGSVSAGELVAASAHADILYIGDLESVTRYLAETGSCGDVVITLGAGDSNRVGEMLLAQLSGMCP